MNKKLSQRFLGYVFLAPYITLFAAFLLLPLCYGLLLSFFRWEMISPAGPEFIAFGNYFEALTSEYFWKAIWATFRFVIMTVPAVVGLALLVACGINALPIKKQSFYQPFFEKQIHGNPSLQDQRNSMSHILHLKHLSHKYNTGHHALLRMGRQV